jgi:ubiquinone/menaquinone biosynthesis C-methylase UbiE
MDEHEWPKLKSTIYSWLWRNPKSNRIVVDAAALSREDRTLDIGCGPGVAVRHAAATVSRAVGVDRSPSMVDIARRRSPDLPNVEFTVGQAEDLPFPDDDFTVAWCAHSFHHWADRDAGLTECRRVLAPGGRLLILETRTTGDHGLSLDKALDLSARLEELGYGETSLNRYGDEYVVGAVASG